MSLIFNERSLTAVLFEMNNKSFDFCEYKAKNHDLNNCLLIRSLFTKITLNENCKRLCSYFLTCIKTIFIMCFIMSDDRSIISLSLHLIVAFHFFYNERDNFEFEKKFIIKIWIEIILKKKSARENKEWSYFHDCLHWCDLICVY